MCDAVAIAIPTSMHEELIVTSLLAGKHVFCEKPLVLTLDAVRRVYKLGEKSLLNINRQTVILTIEKISTSGAS